MFLQFKLNKNCCSCFFFFINTKKIISRLLVIAVNAGKGERVEETTNIRMYFMNIKVRRFPHGLPGTRKQAGRDVKTLDCFFVHGVSPRS